jgi:hypothetical protein
MDAEIRAMPTQDGSSKTTVTLEDFIRLFVNYRPVFAIEQTQFDKAFKALYQHDERMREARDATGHDVDDADDDDELFGSGGGGGGDDDGGNDGGGDVDVGYDGATAPTPAITRENLVAKLLNMGEQMSPGVARRCFELLLGTCGDCF